MSYDDMLEDIEPSNLYYGKKISEEEDLLGEDDGIGDGDKLGGDIPDEEDDDDDLY